MEYSIPLSPIHPLSLFHAQLLEKRGFTYFKFDAVKTIYLANRDCLPPPLSAATWNEAFGAINRHDLKAIIKMLDLGLIVPNSQDVLGTSVSLFYPVTPLSYPDVTFTYVTDLTHFTPLYTLLTLSIIFSINHYLLLTLTANCSCLQASVP